MTSVQTMGSGGCRAIAALLIAGAVLLAGTGCGERLKQPETLASPYESAEVWAVAPFLNESGVSSIDTAALADRFAEQAQQVAGVDAIPVNRVIRAMRALDMAAVQTPADALTLMNVLGIDGIIVGTITAWDPYRPPRLALAVQLFRWPRPPGAGALDARAFTRSTTGEVAPGEFGSPLLTAQAAGVFEASNHATLRQLREYAAARVEPGSAYGTDIYLVNMDLYTEFVSFRLMHDLLDRERTRLTSAAPEQQTR